MSFQKHPSVLVYLGLVCIFLSASLRFTCKITDTCVCMFVFIYLKLSLAIVNFFVCAAIDHFIITAYRLLIWALGAYCRA